MSRSYVFLLFVNSIVFGAEPAVSFVGCGTIQAKNPPSYGTTQTRLWGGGDDYSSVPEHDEPAAMTSTEFMVRVQYEETGVSEAEDTISVRQGESLLNALERAASSRGWSEVPSDCRRGNCLTCCAKHLESSNQSHIQPLSEDGLSPALSLNADQDDDTYILTCRSTVTGPGVALLMGQHTAIWKYMYKSRLESDATRQAADAALARVLRKSAEQDPVAWRAQTEALLQQHDDDNIPFSEENHDNES